MDHLKMVAYHGRYLLIYSDFPLSFCTVPYFTIALDESIQVILVLEEPRSLLPLHTHITPTAPPPSAR